VCYIFCVPFSLKLIILLIEELYFNYHIQSYLVPFAVYTNIIALLFLLCGFYFIIMNYFPRDLCRMDLNHELPRATLNAIKFDLMTSTDMEKLSSISIIEVSDVTSPKLGLPNGSPQCETCGSQSERDCDGHFGVTKLAATVHNPYFIDEVVHFLNQICPGCLSPRESIDLKIMKAFAESSPC
jgi:hypothetical protein